jgi:hypothetical protein
MSYINFSSLNDLQSYCAEFDTQHGCKTIFTKMTLEYLRQFLNKPYEHDYIDGLVQQMFAKSTVVFSNDLNVPESPIGKLNSFYLINQDLKSNKKFYSPISVTLLPDCSIMHPGSTRLLFSHLYKDPVSIMITDYTRECLEVNRDFDFDPVQSVLHSGYSQDTNDPYVPKNFRKIDCWFNQIVDGRVNFNDLSYHVPRKIKPPRIFQLRNHLVTANDVPILRYSKKHWRIVLE